MNNLDPDVAERPEDLVVYGGTGRAARSWEAFDAIVRTLRTLAGDETLLVQSGKPVGVFRTHEWAPRVLIANSNLVPEWATWDEFRRLEDLGLTMYGQMTAGSWIYIGARASSRAPTSASPRSRAAATAGLWRHRHADRRTRRHGRRAAARRDHERRRCPLRRGRSRAHRAAPSDPLPRRAGRRPRRRHRPLHRGGEDAAPGAQRGLCANAADILPALLERGFEADIVTDQTSAHDPLNGYVPNRMTLAEALELRASDPEEYVRRSAPRSLPTARRW